MGAMTFREALQLWLESVTNPDESKNPPQMDSVQLTLHPKWNEVRAQIELVAPPDRRPDLYSKAPGDGPPRLQALTFLEDTGLRHLLQVAAQGFYVDLDALANEIEALFAAPPASAVEEWVVVDADLPVGTRMVVGGYTLTVPTSEDLKRLLPLPSAYEFVSRRRRVDADFLGGATFLHRADPEMKPLGISGRGLRIFFDTRPELRLWRPLLPLTFWRHDVLILEAIYAIEPGKRIDVLMEDLRIDIRTYSTVQNIEFEEEYHRTGNYEVTESNLERFTAFCETVDAMIEAILDADNRSRKKNSPERKRAARLTRAAEHIVRASQRSYEQGAAWEEEEDELILHYVIAMEALLADEEQTDLSRKVVQRAAALGLTDRWRLMAADIVRKAYGARSKYAHGDERIKVDLPKLRQVSLAVLLRWLIVQVAFGKNLQEFHAWLDKSLLSDEIRQEIVADPLREFFALTPPARLPLDAKELLGPRSSA